MIYRILEENMPRLEKKLTRIENKCKKYNLQFTYNKVGEEYTTLNTNEIVKHILVEANGIAKINDEWEFIARVEQELNGNVFYGRRDDLVIPDRYRDCDITCEHCGNKRTKKAFIVYNGKTNEFKSVGRNCLCDYINGLDAEQITSYYSLFDELIKGEEPYTGISYETYYPVKEALRYVVGAVNQFGYVKKESDPHLYTGLLSHRFYLYDNSISNPYMDKEQTAMFEMCNFNHDVTEMLQWISEQKSTSDYIHNLKTICASGYATEKTWNIMASLVPTYRKAMEKQKKLETSEYVGNIGDRIELSNIEIVCVTGYETEYGYTYIYKITDKASGNVFSWKTSKYLETDKVKSIKGTIKAHTDKYGKQTELTRCKVA